MEYLIIILITFIGLYNNSKLAKSLRYFWIFTIWIASTLIIGLRYRVGIDTLNYMESFLSFPTFDNFAFTDLAFFRYEPLYTLLNIACKSMFKNFWSLQIICAAITNGCIFIFLNKYCKNPFIGILLYLYIAFLYFSTEIIRESIAIGIFLLNYPNLRKGKWLKYYLISLLSIGFHYSAIIIWFFPFVKLIRFNIIYIALLIAIVFVTPFAETLNATIELGTINNRIDNYINGSGLNMNYRIGLMIQNVLPGAIAYLFLKKSEQETYFKQFFLLQVLFCFGAFAIPIIFQRFINYTQLFTIVLISYCFEKRTISMIKKCTLIFIILISQLQYYYISYNIWFPYVSVLDPHKIHERELMWKYQF